MSGYSATYHEESRTSSPVMSHKTTTVKEKRSSSGPVVTSQTVGPITTTTTGPVVTSQTQYSYSTGIHGNHSGQMSHSMASHTGQHSQGRIISTVQGEARETGQSSVIASRTGEARYTGETRVVEQYQSGSHLVDTRVVGVEKGIERQVSVTEVAVGEEVIGQRTVPIGKGRRGKKVIREVVEERTVTIPVTTQVEEWVEDEYDMEETVIEVAKKFQIEKIVEVPEIEIVERIIEQVEKVVREKVVEVPKIQTIEKIVEIPVIQTVEKVVEVPEIQYRDVPVEKIVEVQEVKTEEVIREVKRAHFVDKPIERKKLVADHRPHQRKLPVPVEAETVVEFTVPHLRANYVKKKFPVYLPRFVEVPVSRQFVDSGAADTNDKYAARVANLCFTKPGEAAALCDVENLAKAIKEFDSQIGGFHNKKFAIGAHMDEQSKKSMFASQHHQLEQYAAYKHLPVDVSEIHVGHYHSYLGHESPVTYSSATFGNTSASAYSISSASYSQHHGAAHSYKLSTSYASPQYLPSTTHHSQH